MFYKSKTTAEVVELLYSDNSFCIVTPAKEIDSDSNELDGSIFYGNKKEFKKHWKKCKGEFTPLEEDSKKSIVDTFLYDKKLLLHGEEDRLIVETQLHYEKGKQ